MVDSIVQVVSRSRAKCEKMKLLVQVPAICFVQELYDEIVVKFLVPWGSSIIRLWMELSQSQSSVLPIPLPINGSFFVLQLFLQEYRKKYLKGKTEHKACTLHFEWCILLVDYIFETRKSVPFWFFFLFLILEYSYICYFFSLKVLVVIVMTKDLLISLLVFPAS